MRYGLQELSQAQIHAAAGATIGKLNCMAKAWHLDLAQEVPEGLREASTN